MIVEYVPPFAPVAVLAFLCTAFLLAIAAAAFLVAAWMRNRRLAAAILIGIACVLGLYGGTLLASSTLSRERILRLGEKKYFCEIDCHLAYSVAAIEVAKTIGAPPHVGRADGTFHVVTLRTWFDESTISPARDPEAPLYPNPRVVYVQDAAGRRYEHSLVAEDALMAMGRRSTPLTRPLRPGESYVTILAFDLPVDSREPRLFVGCAPGMEFALISHEMSPLHKKVWFSLE